MQFAITWRSVLLVLQRSNFLLTGFVFFCKAVALLQTSLIDTMVTSGPYEVAVLAIANGRRREKFLLLYAAILQQALPQHKV